MVTENDSAEWQYGPRLVTPLDQEGGSPLPSTAAQSVAAGSSQGFAGAALPAGQSAQTVSAVWSLAVRAHQIRATGGRGHPLRCVEGTCASDRASASASR